MTDWRDLSARLDRAAYKHVSDPVLINGEPARGMFQAPWLQPRLGGLNTEVTEPTIVMQDADVVAVKLGNTAQHAGVLYEIVSIEPDGTGLTALVLRQSLVLPSDPDPDPEPDEGAGGSDD